MDPRAMQLLIRHGAEPKIRELTSVLIRALRPF